MLTYMYIDMHVHDYNIKNTDLNEMPVHAYVYI